MQQSSGHNQALNNLTSQKTQEAIISTQPTTIVRIITHSRREKSTETTKRATTKDVDLGTKSESSGISGINTSIKTTIIETQSAYDKQDVSMTVTSRTKSTDIPSSTKRQTGLVHSTSMISHSSISTQVRHLNTLHNADVNPYPETKQPDNELLNTSEANRTDSSHFLLISGGCAALAVVLVLVIAVAVLRFKTSKTLMYV